MMRPSVFGVRVSVLFALYRWRLRDHPVKELLAGAGVAVGVALIFGVLVANTSMTRSADELVGSIVGNAQLQLAARSADGMPASIADAAAKLPGVEEAVPVLRVQATLDGPAGRQPVQVMGVTPALARLGGTRTEGWGRGGIPLADGLTLPRALGEAVGAEPSEPITLLVGGQPRPVTVGALLGREAIGMLDGTPVGIAPLAALQAVADMPDRISQVLVRADPAQLEAVERELGQLAGQRYDVAAADRELELLRTTAAPNDLSTGLFAAISAIVGFLLAFNAILLTVPERRRWIAEVRLQGWSARQVLLVLAFDAAVLGLVASVVGVVLGSWLSRTLFDDVPAYLAFAFPIGTQRIVTSGAVAMSIAGGVIATLVASMAPALDLTARRPDAILSTAGEAGEGISRSTTTGLALGGVAIVALATLLTLITPGLAVVAGVLLAVAALCLIPAVFAATTSGLARLANGLRRSVLPLALIELRATATRSIALAAVAAVAVYGCVAIEGARTDLVRGLDANFAEYLDTTDLWITTGGDDLTTNTFTIPAETVRAIERLPAVEQVRRYQGGLLDIGDRRVWVIARSADDRAMLPASQMVEGDPAAAAAGLRAGGVVAVSEALAHAQHLDVGDHLTLPTPTGPTRLRVAAVTTNLGWPPGAVILNRTDYQRSWATEKPTALQIDLKPGSDPDAAAAAVRHAVATPALRVQTTQQRTDQYASLSRQGLRSLQQIATLLLIAAGLAIALALTAALAQRRQRIAQLKIDGFSHFQLWRAVLCESTIVLVLGAGVGALLGLYGHALASRWLQATTGFPAPFSLGAEQTLTTVTLLAAIALATLAVPGWLATRVPPRASFDP